MWIEDDFDDRDRKIKGVSKDKAGELTNAADVEPEGAERSDERPQE
jgi:hypothetical protein